MVDYSSGRLVRRYDICNGVLDADAIINICKMKTHQLETITGAVKNLFGCVHGLSKGASHAKFPDAHSFAQMLIELNLIKLLNLIKQVQCLKIMIILNDEKILWLKLIKHLKIY
jgi:uncharacterized protein (DUF362 family)